jgi:hypothetical protein
MALEVTTKIALHSTRQIVNVIKRDSLFAFAIFWVAFASTAGASAADTYARLHVASVLASTPQLERRVMKYGPQEYAYWEVRGARAGGYVFPPSVSDGVLRNNQEVLIIPLESGGSGAAFSALLYTRKGSATWRFVGYIASGEHGKLGVGVDRGELIATTPVYGPNEAECCPSKWRFVEYALDGIKLRELRSYTRPSKD